MTADRRRGSESSPTRQLLLDETERLMLEEGYAAVGVRRLAREAGVAPALVLYYFKTLDDLFLAVLKRRADGEFERQQRLLDSKPPLQALWELNRDPGLALITEFMALANHREAVRVAFAADAERYRKAQVEAIMRKAESGLPDVSPAALVVATTGIARILGMESALGITGGHEETVALIEDLLKRFYGSSSLAVDHD